MKRALILGVTLLFTLSIRAATIATFNTSVGSWDLELYDEARPITVSNFIKYGTSGRYANQLIHRWVPGFVIQGGGFRVDTSNPAQYQIVPVEKYGNILNEARISTNYSNVYGTIAMARVGGQVNSANSQWFINLKDNGGPPANLDTVDEGFTVFGRVISATNILNLFIPNPPANGIHINDTIIPGSPMAVLVTNDLGYDDLVYVHLTFRRDLDVEVTRRPDGTRRVGWASVAGVTNALEYSTNFTTWTTVTNLIGTGNPIQVADSSTDLQRIYRVKLLY
jgi:cyclophilin family peptidyl-prolyl cis-trans isomerase